MHEQFRHLPALDPLKGFEAAARHLSFTRAAQELFVTQSAISRQIQTLEEQLGVKLFRRETRKLALTAEGELLARAAGDALSRLAEVCANLKAPRRRPLVTVSSALGIAALWLVPRLAAFQEVEPDVDVRLSADNRVVDLAREDFDLALRYGATEPPPPNSSLLFGEVVFPVASPKVAKRLPRKLCADDLAKVTLLAFEGAADKTPWLDWTPWLQALGLGQARPKAVIQFNHYDQMIRAAEDGRGVALGRGPLVAQALASRRLVALTDARQHVPARAYFLVRAPRPLRPEVERFAAWLSAEAEKTEREAEV